MPAWLQGLCLGPSCYILTVQHLTSIYSGFLETHTAVSFCHLLPKAEALAASHQLQLKHLRQPI